MARLGTARFTWDIKWEATKEPDPELDVVAMMGLRIVWAMLLGVEYNREDGGGAVVAGTEQPGTQVVSNLNQNTIECNDAGKEKPTLPTREGNGQPGTQGPDMETKAVHVEDVGPHDGEYKHLARLGEELICAIEEGSQAKETKTTWSSILGRQAVSKKNLPYYAPSIVEGKPIVHVNSSHFAHLQESYENLIIGGFVGRKLPFSFVRETLTRTWRLKNNFIMKTYGESMFSFQFNSDEDRK
ncbi:hypothetical protein FRX31_013497 [Thalictrum thalictroides]|uniref:Uncharacterized protein n=1 Tax=Thalictrum thalictroides TaxID=46969 RepID=A0A7J6WKB5_THATH|nr:hypothetical protein FRX31_013497 [Thalictrum thalictroides]